MFCRYGVIIALFVLVFIAHPMSTSAQRLEKTTPTRVEALEDLCSPDSEFVTSDDQGSAQVARPPSARISTYPRQFLHRMLEDQKMIWTSPFQLRTSDAKWLGPLAASALVTLAIDNKTAAKVNPAEELTKNSNRFSVLGSGYATFGVAGALYGIGRLTHNDRAQETGLLGAEALIQTSIVVTGLKLAFERERPSKFQSDGSFWEGGSSFPSGHAAVAFTIATVIAEEYRDKPAVQITAYGLAAAVAVSRVAGRNHFPTDVLAGGVIGYFIGRSIVTTHSSLARSRKMPSISPYVSRQTRDYGLRATFGL
jgi:PAP2 superfamily protein